MGFLKNMVVGRDNGVRSRLKGKLLGGGANTHDTSPDAAYSAPGKEYRPPPAEAALGLSPEPPRDVIPPEGYEVVLHKDSLVAGKAVEIIIAGRAIVVANVGGTFYACHNTCPHADGPLGDGKLDGKMLTCPYHGYEFDLEKGSCKTDSGLKLATYSVEVVDTAVCVKL